MQVVQSSIQELAFIKMKGLARRFETYRLSHQIPSRSFYLSDFQVLNKIDIPL
jgi:hypothetical protein